MNKLKQTVILLLVLLSCSCSLLSKPTGIVYLIPENFIGGVIILYNQSDGITPETNKDGTVIYRIPQDGFLKVKPALKRNSYKFNFYFVDAADKLTPIEYLHPEAYVRDPGDTTSKSRDSITEDERINKTFVMNHATTNFNVGEEKIYLHNFIIDKPNNSLKTFTKMLDKIDAIEIEISKAKANKTNDE